MALGFQGNSVSFDWRPFDERSPSAQEAFRRLERSLLDEGLRSPLITYKGHVLVGQRRFEILRDRRSEFVCFEVTEEVENWRGPDIERLNAFKRDVYPDMQEFAT